MNAFFTLDRDSIALMVHLLHSDHTDKAIIREQSPNAKGDTWVIACHKHDDGRITLHNLTKPYALEHGFKETII